MVQMHRLTSLPHEEPHSGKETPVTTDMAIEYAFVEVYSAEISF